MNINELIDQLPMHPLDAFNKAIDNQATEDGFFLYEIHHMHFDRYESHVWIFPTIKDFVDFLPAIVFNDIAVNWEDYSAEDNDNYNYSNDYIFFKSLVSQEWDLEQCINFVKKHKNFETLELIEFGKISDLIEVSINEYDKCKETYLSLNELENIGLTEFRYKIFHKFHELSDDIPSKNKTLFLEMIDQWEN